MYTIVICDENRKTVRELRNKIEQGVLFYEELQIIICDSQGLLKDFPEEAEVIFFYQEGNQTEFLQKVRERSKSVLLVQYGARKEQDASLTKFAPIRYLTRKDRESCGQGEVDEVLQTLLCNRPRFHVPVCAGKSNFLLCHKEIMYLENERTGCCVHPNPEIEYDFIGQSLRCQEDMEELQERLQEVNFFRIHMSYVVNMECISDVHYMGKSLVARLFDNTVLGVSRNRREEFLEAFSEYRSRRYAGRLREQTN